MTTPEMITVGIGLAGIASAQIIAQRTQIAGLIGELRRSNEERHRLSEDRQGILEERLNETVTDLREIDGRLGRVETACQLRHPAALPKGA